MKKLNNMELIVEMGMVDNKKTNNNIVNTTKRKKISVDINKRNDNKKFTLVAEMSNNKSKKRSVNNNKNDENKKFTLVAEMNNNRSKKIAEMSNNKSKKRNYGIANTNKSKKRSANNNNKRNKNKKFTLEYYVGKCVEVAATKGFKIKGEKMWAIGMFEINEAKYLLTVDKYGLLFWFVDLATLVIAVTRYLEKSQDDNYDLNCHYIPICDVWLSLIHCY